MLSDYRDIGLWGEVILGSAADHLRRIIKRDSIRLVVAVISLTLSLIFLLLYFLRERQRSFLYLCLITLAMVVRVAAETHIKQHILQAPLFFEFVKAIGYFVLPLFVILFLQEILGEQYRRLTRVAAAVVFGPFGFTMIGCAVGWFRLCDTYLLFDIVAVCTMVFLGVLSVKAAAAGMNQSLEEKVRERTRQLELANRQLREEKVTLQITSITDGLTGVYNRTYVLERFEQEVGEAKRYRKSLSVIMFDLDHFKRVNDFYGHQVGDSVLQRVAQIFRYNMRDSDLIGRYGGEEFLNVLPETDCTEAALVAERIRNDVEWQQWSEQQLRVTLSGGVSEYSGGKAEQLIRSADALMYRAKQLGRNRIVSETTLSRRPAEDAG